MWFGFLYRLGGPELNLCNFVAAVMKFGLPVWKKIPLFKQLSSCKKFRIARLIRNLICLTGPDSVDILLSSSSYIQLNCNVHAENPVILYNLYFTYLEEALNK